MSTNYKPGTVAVATVRGASNVRALWSGHAWLHGNVDGHNGSHASKVTDVHPLVVLDLDDLGPRSIDYAATLRHAAKDESGLGQTGAACILNNLADQIEAQTRPPRCEAALIIKGEHFFCDSQPGHTLPHGSRDAEAIWGGVTA